MLKQVDPTPALSVVILSYNTRALLLRCLDLLHRAAQEAQTLPLEVIVIDNASGDDSVAAVREHFPAVTLVANAINCGFAAANNQGLALAQAPAVLLLNSDAFVTAPALRKTLDMLASRPRAGLIGLRLVNPDGSTQAEWGVFPTFLGDLAAAIGIDRIKVADRRHLTSPPVKHQRVVDWVQGAFMLVRTAALADVGGIDEKFFMYSEEVDWCHRFWRSGWEVWYSGDVSVVHIGGASSTGQDFARRKALYRSRLGLRRRLGGPIASCALWVGMLGGMVLRAVVRGMAHLAFGWSIGQHSAHDDWQLTYAIARMDPLAQWAAVESPPRISKCSAVR